MKRAIQAGFICIALAALMACGGTDEPTLAASEAFTWGGQPISFSPPPPGWERKRSQPGGREGVEFIKAGSVGEVIGVEEAFFLGNRDRCDRLKELMRDLDNLDSRKLALAIQKARLYARPALNSKEEQWAEAANDSLDRARAELREGDSMLARDEIATAYEQAGMIRYSIDEVVDRVLYDPKGLPPYISVEIGEPTSGELAGEPAVAVSYIMKYSGRTYEGRQIYVVKNNRLFVIRFQGLAENVPLFERIVRTVSFPAGECEH
jgi:hypothetical protein